MLDWHALFKKAFVSPDLEQHIDRIPTHTGSFGYDAWGYNPEESKVAFALVKQLYDKYFRVEANGLEHIPAQGRVLVIANHSGQIPMDGILIGVALTTNPHGPRAPRAMIERFFPTVPFIGNFLNKAGAVIGDPVNCARMLDEDDAVIVFPEGIRGSGKLYKDRYKLKRFGNGFLHLAMQHRTPIVPVGVVGCEETMPTLANLKPLANLLHIPYVPLALPLILPAKVHLEFGEPIFFENDAENEEEVTNRVDRVKDAIRGLIDQGLRKRKRLYL